MHVHDIMRHAAAGSHVRHTCRHTSVQSPIVLVNIASKYSQGDESTGQESSVEALRQRGEPNSFSNK